MPTTVRRVQRLKERRRAQQARRREEEERRQRERQAEHGYSPSASPSKEKLGDRCRRQCRRLWAQQSGCWGNAEIDCGRCIWGVRVDQGSHAFMFFYLLPTLRTAWIQRWASFQSARLH